MSVAWIPTVKSIEHSGSSLIAKMDVAFTGADVSGAFDISEITVELTPQDTPVTLASKITDAVVADATRIGYDQARGAMLIPTYIFGT